MKKIKTEFVILRWQLHEARPTHFTCQITIFRFENSTQNASANRLRRKKKTLSSAHIPTDEEKERNVIHLTLYEKCTSEEGTGAGDEAISQAHITEISFT